MWARTEEDGQLQWETGLGAWNPKSEFSDILAGLSAVSWTSGRREIRAVNPGGMRVEGGVRGSAGKDFFGQICYLVFSNGC